MGKSKKVRRSKRNILSRGLSNIKSTTKKIIPGVTTQIEGVGSRVIGTAKQSLPKAQRSIRNLFGMFTLSSSKRKARRTRRKH